MTCREFEEQIDDRLGDRDRPASLSNFESSLGDAHRAHLAECLRCRRRLRQVAWLDGVVVSMPKPRPNSTLSKSVVDRLKRESVRKPVVIRPVIAPARYRSYLGTMALAASICVAVFIAKRTHFRHATDTLTAVKPVPTALVNDLPLATKEVAKPDQEPKLSALAKTRGSGFSLIGRGLTFAVQTRAKENMSMTDASKKFIGPSLVDVDVAKRISDRVDQFASASRSVGAGVKPIGDSAGRAFAFLWNDLGKASNPN